MKKLFLLLIIAITIFSNKAEAISYLNGITTTNNLNVREEPNTKSKSIDKLKKGIYIIILKAKGKWLYVSYIKDLKSNKSINGWVHSNFIYVSKQEMNRYMGKECYYNTRGAEFCVEITDKELNCNESYSGGYESCDINIDYDITSDYNGDNTPSVDVSCKVDIEYKIRDSYYPNSESESKSETTYMYSNYSSEEMEIDISFYSYEPVTSVNVEDIKCSIDNVF